MICGMMLPLTIIKNINVENNPLVCVHGQRPISDHSHQYIPWNILNSYHIRSYCCGSLVSHLRSSNS